MILTIYVLQTGLKLMLDSSEEDFLVALLVSLSKIASKSTILISEQVPFSLSYCDFLSLLLLRQGACKQNMLVCFLLTLKTFQL